MNALGRGIKVIEEVGPSVDAYKILHSIPKSKLRKLWDILIISQSEHKSVKDTNAEGIVKNVIADMISPKKRHFV